MADHPCSLGPPVPCLADAKQVDVPVEVALHVGHRHPCEAPEASLDPWAEAVGESHAFEVFGVTHVGLA